MATSSIADGRIRAQVDSMGAQLTSLMLDGGEYLWQRDDRWWTGSSPVLFPFVGSLRGGRASSAQGDIALGRHGLARLHEHALVSHGDDFLTYELRSSDATRAGYPYDFCLRMTYRVKGDALEQEFFVENTGDVPLPFVVGGHPAFNVPLPDDGGAYGDWTLRFAEPWTYASPLLVAGTGLVDWDERLPLLDQSDSLALDHAVFERSTLIFENVPQRTVTLEGPAGHGVSVDFEGFDYLGVWSAAGNAPFVALEPWCGTTTRIDEDDVFEHKQGMICLEPKGHVCKSFTVRLF